MPLELEDRALDLWGGIGPPGTRTPETIAAKVMSKFPHLEPEQKRAMSIEMLKQDRWYGRTHT